MKSLLTIILTTSIIGIAIFGVPGMHVGMQNHDSGCVAAITRGADCPKQANLLEYLSFHLDTFQDLFRATFGGENLLAFLLASILLTTLAGLALFFENLIRIRTDFAYSLLKRHDVFSYPLERQILRWLAIHENSPNTL